VEWVQCIIYKDNNNQIRFNIGQPLNGKNYGIVAAVNGYGRSNEVYMPVVSGSSRFYWRDSN